MDEEDIERNLKKVKNNEALDMPLAVLNGQFKQRYKEKFGEFEKLSPEEVKAHQREYKRAYNQRPEVKAHKKACMKAYYQRKKKEQMK